MSESLLTLAITMGDPAGVGPELCLRVLGNQELVRRCVPVVFGDLHVLKKVASRASVPWPAGLQVISMSDWQRGAEPDKLAVVDVEAIEAEIVEAGQLSASCGQAAYRYIETAVRAVQAHRAAALVTAPINKEALWAAGVRFPGHTEILGELTGACSYCMMLTSPALTVSFVTTHQSLTSVSEALTVERICEVIVLTAQAMVRLTGRDAPRIGVCGLNPHAGEHGLFGNEESNAIAPAIDLARAQGIEVDGPLAPDTAFTERTRAGYQAIVCMYHDQGHIPFKMIAFETGVNVTLGLPIIRTSVDHGTAFDIAWQGQAKPSSLVAAMHLAVRLAQGRGEQYATGRRR